MTFEELGVDRLFVGEADFYKNLFLYTKMPDDSRDDHKNGCLNKDNFMVEIDNVRNFAAMIFDGTKWDASDEERGLSKLNKRLIEGGKKIWDTFAEHNFCYELIQHNPSSIPILYEPNEFEGKTLNRPPDFVIHERFLPALTAALPSSRR